MIFVKDDLLSTNIEKNCGKVEVKATELEMDRQFRRGPVGLIDHVRVGKSMWN